MTRVTIYFLRNQLAALDGRAGRPHNQRMTSATSTTRIRKLLALSASAALIGSAHEAQAALNRAMIIAQDNRIEIAPLAAAAGVELPRPKPAPLADRSSAGDTGRGYTLTRTVRADERLELCTLNAGGRTEVYFDEDGSGIRMFQGYLDELDRDFYQQVLPLAKLHWTTHDRFHGLRR